MTEQRFVVLCLLIGFIFAVLAARSVTVAPPLPTTPVTVNKGEYGDTQPLPVRLPPLPTPTPVTVNKSIAGHQ